MESVEINGTEPPIIGRRCEAIVTIEYHHGGQIIEPANVVFLRFANRWCRLYFDYGTVFWRDDTDGPTSLVAPELDAEHRAIELVDLVPVRDRQLAEILYSPIEGGIEFVLRFDPPSMIVFRCVNDLTTYVLVPPP